MSKSVKNELASEHCRAICEEIGYRLGQVLRPDELDHSEKLAALLRRLEQMETDLTEDRQSPQKIWHRAA